MTLLLYVVAGLFIAFGLVTGLIFASQRPLYVGPILGGLCYLIGGMAAIYYLSWWPLLVGFGLVWLVRLRGGDPGYH